jgi:nitrate reductase gamma subunit
VYVGGAAGVVTFAGAGILLFRRYENKRVSRTSSFADKLILVLLSLAIASGIYNTLFYNLTAAGFDYRSSIAPWFRSLFIFSPDPSLMDEVPFFFKIHALLAFALLGVWPFSRLVHIWSIPIAYLMRSRILYRR